MNQINILSLVHASEIQKDIFDNFLLHYGVEIKSSEIIDLKKLIQLLKSNNATIDNFENFYVGYKIPQIGKEFDLLRFGSEFILNIELKREVDDDIKILTQIKRNKFYLEFLGKEIFIITFVADRNKFYSIDNDLLFEVNVTEVINLLKNQLLEVVEDINKLFDPSNYLVSPFNTTEQFIFDHYFLTGQQEEISNQIKKHFLKKDSLFFSVSGKAGTGKTLFAYDIAKHFINQEKRVLIVHCGLLNEGHYKLIENLEWEIIAIKNLHSKQLENYDFIVVDECQRIFVNQLLHIKNIAEQHLITTLFVFDPLQFLKQSERRNDIEGKINSECNPISHILTEKVRSNKEIASFTRSFFNRSKSIKPISYNNIIINYFLEVDTANEYIISLKRSNYWKIINLTPSSYDNHPYDKYHQKDIPENSHTVIGQEFDNVVLIIDEYFCYNDDDIITIRNYRKSPNYSVVGMLYQNITRSRKRLNIIIINNPEILTRCNQIKNYHKRS